MAKDETDQSYQLTAKVFRLGSGVFSSMDLKQRLLPYLRNLNRGLDVTTHCAILDDAEVVTIERIRSRDVVNLDITAGTRLPVHATSLGKAIAAYLPPEEQKRLVNKMDFKPLTPRTIKDARVFLDELKKTRYRGYAMAVEELTLGLKTMAVPVLEGEKSVKAAFGVSYPISREKEEGLEEKLIKSLLMIKDQLSLF